MMDDENFSSEDITRILASMLVRFGLVNKASLVVLKLRMLQ